MQATRTPWLEDWLRLHDPQRLTSIRDQYWRTGRMRFYTLADDEHRPRQIYRIERGPGGRHLVFSSQGPVWLRERLPITHDTEPWRLPALPPDFKVYHSVVDTSRSDPLPGGSAVGDVGTKGPAHSDEWGTAALGWAGGTVVLALFVVLVRAAERCLDKRLFKSMRRRSEEWQTPDVLATRLNQNPHDSELGIPPEGIQPDSNSIVDLPPPYSECAGPSTEPKYSISCEDPPPPYSACYVAFCNPKDGVLSVRIRPIISDTTNTSDNNCDNIGNTSTSEQTIEITENPYSNTEEVINDANSIIRNEPNNEIFRSSETLANNSEIMNTLNDENNSQSSSITTIPKPITDNEVVSIINVNLQKSDQNRSDETSLTMGNVNDALNIDEINKDMGGTITITSHIKNSDVKINGADKAMSEGTSVNYADLNNDIRVPQVDVKGIENMQVDIERIRSDGVFV